MFDAGGWVLLESAIADLPADLRWLFESGAVTIDHLSALHGALGAMSIADLLAELRRESIRRVPGLDETVETAIRSALPALRAAVPRIPLGRAMSLADPVLARLRAAGAAWARPVGSLRRGLDLVGDIEIVAAMEDPAPAIESLLDLPDLARTLHRGPRRLYLVTRPGEALSYPIASPPSLTRSTISA